MARSERGDQRDGEAREGDRARIRDRPCRGADLLGEASRGSKRIPVLPVFVDSPMATDALARYAARLNELDPELQPEAVDDKAPHDASAHEPRDQRRRHAREERKVCAFCTERFRTIASAEESKQLTQSKMPAIVISASGMATGGRVLHHLKAGLPDSRNTVLFVGFQAEGTRGRQLVDGRRSVKIHGRRSRSTRAWR